MPFIAETAQLTVTYDYANQPWGINTFLTFNAANATVDQAAADALAAEWVNLLNTETIGGSWSDNFKIDSITLRRNDQPGFLGFESPIQISGNGGTGTELPAQTSYCVSHIGSGGQARGRSYLFGFTEGVSVGTPGRPTQELEAHAISYFDSLAQACSNQSREWLLYRNIGTATNPSYVVDPRAASYRSQGSSADGWQVQRRRRDGLTG